MNAAIFAGQTREDDDRSSRDVLPQRSSLRNIRRKRSSKSNSKLLRNKKPESAQIQDVEFSDPENEDASNKGRSTMQWFRDQKWPHIQHRGASRLSAATLLFADAGKNAKRLAPGAAENLDSLFASQGSQAGSRPIRQRFGVSGSTCAQRSVRMRQLWTLMCDPESSKSAYTVSIVSLSAVIVMSAILCLETMPDLQGNPRAQLGLWAIEAVCTCVFILEYVAKVISAPSRLAYVLTLEAIIDVVTIMPFFVGLGICGLQSCESSNGSLKLMLILRTFRLSRIFRVLKVSQRMSRASLIADALTASSDVIIMLAFLLLLSMLIFSALVYETEHSVMRTWDPATGETVYFPASSLADRGIDGALSHIPADHPVDNPFSSIPATFWFMIVTLMTVGYGDMVPTTVTGRLIAVASMILSMLVLALPMSVVGTNFAQAWVEDQERNRIGVGDEAEGRNGDGGNSNRRFFGPGRPPQVQALAQALLVHRGNVDDLCMQLRSLCHGLEDSLEGFAEEAAVAGRRIGSMLDVILEAELDGRIDLEAAVEHEAALQQMMERNAASLERQAQGLTDSLRAADTVMHVTEQHSGPACSAPDDEVACGERESSVSACAASTEGRHAQLELTDALEEFLDNCESVAYERQQLGRYNERLLGLERVAAQAMEMLKDLQCGTQVTLDEPPL